MIRRLASSIVNNAKRAHYENKRVALVPLLNNKVNEQNKLAVNYQIRCSSKAVSAPTSFYAVVLSGCGYLDGTEVTEAVSIMIHLSRKGYGAIFFAPTGEQTETIDHNKKELEKHEARDMMSESSRITRQKTLPLTNLKAKNFEGLIIPGGFGVAKNLTNYAYEPTDFTVDNNLANAIKEFHSEKKPIAACCIAPIIVAKVLGKESGGPGCNLTFGSTAPTVAEHAQSLGNEITGVGVEETVIDEENLILSSPAYMEKAPSPNDVHEGLGIMVDKLVEMATKKKGGSDELDWEKIDYLALRVHKYTKEEWEMIKRDMKEAQERKGK